MENEKNAEKVRSPSDIKLLLTYPAPLYNESYEFKKLRKEMFILMLVGLLLCIIFGPGLLTVIMFIIGLAGIIFAQMLLSNSLNTSNEELSNKKFQFDSKIDMNTVYEEVMPILRTKYAMSAVLNDKGNITITYQNIVYDFAIRDDDSFVLISGYPPVGTATKTAYAILEQKLSAMGIIGYEIQNHFNMLNPHYNVSNNKN